MQLRIRPRKKKYRWTFWRISGKRVSPLYDLCGSATAQAGGENQNDR